ncbi:MAG: ion channel, partial [Acidobacteriota bacterium]
MKTPVDATEDTGLSVFLALLIGVLFAGLPFAAAFEMHWSWPSLLFSALFVVGGVAVAPGRWRKIAFVTGTVALGIEWWAAVTHNAQADVGRVVVFLGFVVALMWAIGLRVMAPGRVTGHRLRGAVALFLLLGLAWAMVYGLLCQFSPGAISVSEQHADLRFAELIFFSYVTLSTLGYGDIVPTSPIAQSLVT